jgi:hypothetical protein
MRASLRSPSVLTTLVVAVALATTGCGGSGRDASASSTPATPVGPWHEGRTLSVADGSDPGRATVTLPTQTSVSIVASGSRLTGIRPKALPGHADNTSTHPGVPLAAPAYDGDGRGVVVIERPLGEGEDPAASVGWMFGGPVALSWMTIDRYGRTGDEHRLAARAEHPTFAADADGNAVVAWFDASSDREDGFQEIRPIRVAVQAHARPFSAPVTLTKTGAGASTEGTAPVSPWLTVAVAGGRIVVAGQALFGGQGEQIAAWTGDVDRGFTDPPVKFGTKQPGVAFTAAMSTTGRAFVAWGDQSSGEDADSPWVVRATSIAPGATAIGPIQRLDGGAAKSYPSSYPILAADPRGGAVLAWSGVDGGGQRGSAEDPIYVSTATAAGTYGVRQRLAPSGKLTGLAVSPAGDAIVTWAPFAEDGSSERQAKLGYFASVRAAGESLFRPAERVPIPFPGDGPPPSFAPSGRPVLAYTVPSTSGVRGETIHTLARDKP